MAGNCGGEFILVVLNQYFKPPYCLQHDVIIMYMYIYIYVVM